MAAAEMRQRIDALLSDGRDRINLTTFHSFAAELLRQHGSHVGLKPDFGILSDQADREAALTDAINTVVSNDDDFRPNAAQLLPTISRMLDECVAPDDPSHSLGTQPRAKAIGEIYSAYRKRLVSANQLDFGSLLALAVDLVEKKPAIAKQIGRVYSYVCVDECQDTNSAQYRLLVHLVPSSHPNLFIVADDDQVIYQWNGASPARLRNLLDRFGMAVIQLPENFRCPPAVIDLANNLIRFNTDRSAGKQPLTAHKTVDDIPRLTVRHFRDFLDELRWIGGRIAEKPANDWAHCAILARRKRLLETAVTVLAEQSVPAYIAVRKNEFESAPYRFLHATLRLANATQDREQLRRMTKAFFDLEGIKIEVHDVIPRASVDQEGYLRAWLQFAEARCDSGSHTENLLLCIRESLADRLNYWAFVESAHNWFSTLLERPVGLVAESAFADYDDEKEIWNSLCTEIGRHFTLCDLSLHSFLQEIDLRAKEKPAPPGAVRCLTIAASKGMEFRDVFLVGMVEDELPGYHARKTGDSSDALREERRNCFVAITRATESLTLTYSEYYFGYHKTPSRFLKEMGVTT